MDKVGRPPAFKNAEELQDKINEYIQSPPTRSVKLKDGTEFDVSDITISGLCWTLGFESRQSFYDYEKKPEFTYTIKRARLYIESQYESCLKSNSCTGSIFALKSMGWDDGSGQDKPLSSYTIEIVNPNAD